jgi:hypothetical protein
MAGTSAERQEYGVVSGINAAVKSNAGNPVTVKSANGKTILTGIIKAEKYGGRQVTGSEPYTDVVLTYRESAKKTGTYNLSLKGESAPSLAGGGLRGLELAVPGLAARFLKAVHTFATKQLKLRMGDDIPDIYGRINASDKIKIVIGNAAMGGPIHYMYIGPMSVTARYDKKKNEVTMNGNLFEALAYAKSHDLLFRLRKRREDQRFDPTALNEQSVPKIYGVSPSRGDSAGRIVIVDKPPAAAHIVSF